MRVLELNTEKTWRGGERHTYYTVKAFRDAGLEVEIVAREGYPLATRCRELGVRVHGVRNNLEALGFLLRKGADYDIIHAQTPKTQGIAVLSKPVHRRPVVCTRLVDFKPRGFLSILKYRLTDRMIALNRSIKEVLHSIGVQRVEIIPIMYETEKPEVERAVDFLKRRGIEAGNRRIVATVSALTPQKDPLTTVRVVEELRKLRDDFLFLHFGDGFMLEEVREEIRRRGLEGVYKLLGFVENPTDFYPLFSVYVMTSLNEGTPLSILDAFHCRVPVVATDIPALRETLQGRGFLCPVRDARCMAERIDRLLSDASLAEEVVERAFRWVTEVFSLDRLALEYIRVFRELV